MGASDRKPRGSLSEHGAPSATAAHLRRLASSGPAPDRSLAMVSRRQRLAAGSEGLPAPVLHPVFRAGGTDRTGRYGELELRPCRESGDDRAALSVHVRAGDGVRSRELRMGRSAVARVGAGHHRGEVERAQPPKSLPPLGGIYGGRELGRAVDLADSRAMSVINLRHLQPGTKIGLSDGSTAEVVSNPLDGIWVFARYLFSPHDAALVGTEEMIFAQDIVEIR